MPDYSTTQKLQAIAIVDEMVARGVAGSGSGSNGITTAANQPDADNAPLTKNPLYTGGKAVDAAVYTPNYSDNDAVGAAYDKASGGLLTWNRRLTASDDEVSVVPKKSATSPTLFAVSLAEANKEYSQIFSNVSSFAFQELTGSINIRYAYETGKVASSTLPYYPLRAGAEESEDLGNATWSGTLYLASSTANTTIVIKVWS